MVCDAPRLSPEVLDRALSQLPDWTCRDNTLERVIAFKTYADGLAVLNRVAALAETTNHHPELLLGYAQLTVRYWTHTANGITELDITAAQVVDALFKV